MFEEAVRRKLRWNFKGQIGVEDLWDLTVKDLDSIYKNLSGQMHELNRDSLLNPPAKEKEIGLKTDIVKHIFKTKMDEKDRAEQRVRNRDLKQRLLEIKEHRQNKQFEEMSDEELQATINAL